METNDLVKKIEDLEKKIQELQHKDDPYLKVVPFGVCPRCLQVASVTDCTENGYNFHYHCVNKDCEEYMEDVIVPREVFLTLSYLSSFR